MTLLDVVIVLVAALVYFFAHAPWLWVVIATLCALALVRVVRGERLRG